MTCYFFISVLYNLKKQMGDMMTTTVQKAGRLFFLLALTNGIGYVGASFMTPDTMNWYDNLKMSALTPPDWVFGVVWTVLFFMMSIAGFLVWNKVSPRWFVAQLGMNLLWTFSFFYLREVIFAAIVILLMLYFLYKCMRDFYTQSHTASFLMVPTFVWSLFALYLNTYIILNN